MPPVCYNWGVAKPATPKLYEEQMGTVKVTQTGETYILEDADGKEFVGLTLEEAASGASVSQKELREAIAAGQGGVAYFDEEDTEVEDDEEDEDVDDETEEEEEK
jgi:phosphopantothenoylcysteine synthetase/decarboxylase